MSVRVRLAPSPTGNLHIGTARTAVFNWLFAQNQKGKFILRIEDTDIERSRPEYTENIMEGLAWLGLEWNEGPFYQSQRLELYQAATQKLLDKGLAYRCYCTEAELEEMREAQKARKEAPRYDNRHRDLTPKQQAAFEAEGRQPVIRFKIDDDRTINWKDLVRGTVTWKGSDLGGDMVISRAASVKTVGQPLYNMAVVVDDMDMEITHVIRGEDHIANTAKQILLYEALEGKVPEFAHTPLILNQEGRKLSKRDGVTSISDFKELGFIPEALANYMCLLGWTPPDSTQEIFTLTEAAQNFTFERVNKAGGKFDWDKLDWINSQYLHNLPVAELTDRLIPVWQKAGYEVDPQSDRPWLEQLAALIGPSLTRLTDAVEMSKLFFSPTVELDAEATEQMQKEDAVKSINSIIEGIDSDAPLRVGDAQKIIKRVTQAVKVKKGIVMRSLRASLTGAMQGPDLIQSWLLLHQRGFDILRFKKAIGQQVEESKKVDAPDNSNKGFAEIKTATSKTSVPPKQQAQKIKASVTLDGESQSVKPTIDQAQATTPTGKSQVVEPTVEKQKQTTTPKGESQSVKPTTDKAQAATPSGEAKTVKPAVEKQATATPKVPTTPTTVKPTVDKQPTATPTVPTTQAGETKAVKPTVEKQTSTETPTVPTTQAGETKTVKLAVEKQASTETPTVPTTQAGETKTVKPAVEKQASTETTLTTKPETVEQQVAAQVETSTLDDQKSVDTTTNETVESDRLQKIKEKLINTFANFPDYISQFYQTYQRQLKVIGSLILIILIFRLILGFLEVLEGITTLSISFELIGMGYSVWFVYRYLLRKSNRQELLDKIQGIKAEIVGKKS
ncbi:glutamate--tRNA ligase [Okeania sp. SIO1H4]|uniref:glutamate--tRNA ligase n=1 Tax=unclassified Okeania TaxID=2634635 RepID=UPI0013B7D62F|nr:glutamate--tRNA ligase [Okeania sp. SIO1H4]NET18645.1 glutamate--tRNA ligase [Okeania sp. SIO1H5]NET92292.1 glutamate--tRNA ligase [Okeania sp. SIO1H2]